MKSPHTKIIEIDKSHYIPHETNEIGMFIGHFERGPIDYPIFITSIDQFKFLFGRGIGIYHQDWYQVYNYLQYTSGIWVCNAGGTRKSNSNNASEIIINTYDDWKNAYDLLAVNKIRIVARTPGIWGNLINIAIIDKTIWDNNSIVHGNIKAQEIFTFFEDGHVGICVFRGNLLVENLYIDISTSIKNIEEVNTTSIYIYAKVQDSTLLSEIIYYNTTIMKFNNGFSSFPTKFDFERTYNLFSDDYSIDIIIGNEKDNILAVNLAEYRKDCIAFLGLPTKEINYLAINIENTNDEILYTTNSCIIALQRFDFPKKMTEYSLNILNRYIASLGTSEYVHFTVNIKLQYDMFTDTLKLVNIAADTAGLKAQASLEQPWVVSAGLERGIIKNLDKIHLILNKKEVNSFYKKGLNITDNNILMSQRTMTTKPTAFNRINVRSLFNHLKKESVKILNRYIFDENTIRLRQSIGTDIKLYLEGIQINKGISRGRVHVYTQNNTIYVDIIIQPTYTVEQITIRMINTGTGIISEIINQG